MRKKINSGKTDKKSIMSQNVRYEEGKMAKHIVFEGYIAIERGFIDIAESKPSQNSASDHIKMR